MNLEEKEKEIQLAFAGFGDDWEQRYEYIIEMGRALPAMKPEYKTEERLIKGCQSKVWLFAELRDGKVYFEADSDAIITKGIISLLIRLFNGHTPSEIVHHKIIFPELTGLQEHLSPTRANGLLHMIRQMKMDALAFTIKT